MRYYWTTWNGLLLRLLYSVPLLLLPLSHFVFLLSLFSAAIDCGSLPNPLNGMVDLSGGTVLGSQAMYSCMAGYQLEGNSTRLCTIAGEWRPEAPTCARSSKFSFQDAHCVVSFATRSINNNADSWKYHHHVDSCTQWAVLFSTQWALAWMHACKSMNHIFLLTGRPRCFSRLNQPH